jgi:hypothetical protein
LSNIQTKVNPDEVADVPDGTKYWANIGNLMAKTMGKSWQMKMGREVFAPIIVGDIFFRHFANI